jgi:AcrR family transcriptional regulator
LETTLTRPRAESDVRIAILDAAELAFAEFGYGGASMRAIAREAGVNQAMIAYYFGSKEGLMIAVVGRRASAINDERARRLDELLERGSPQLVEIVDAFLRPAIELGRDANRGGFAYVKLLAIHTNSTDQLAKRVISENYDHIARRFIAAFRMLAPEMSASAAIRAYLLTLAAGMSTVGLERRADDLADGGYDHPDTDALVDCAVAFASAGIGALMHKT